MLIPTNSSVHIHFPTEGTIGQKFISNLPLVGRYSVGIGYIHMYICMCLVRIYASLVRMCVPMYVCLCNTPLLQC